MQLPFSKQLITAALIVILAPAATVIGAQSFSEFISKPQPYTIAQVEPPSPLPGSPGASIPLPLPSEPSTIGPSQPPPPPSLPLELPPGSLPPPPPLPSPPDVLPGGPPAGFLPPDGQPLPPGSLPGEGEGCRPPPPDLACKVVDKYPNGCPKYECASEKAHCPVPPPDLECTVVDKYPNGCPKYECKAKEGGWSCPAPPTGMKCEEAGKYPNGCVKFKCERPEPPRHERSGPPPELENCAREALGADFERVLTGGIQLTEEQKKLVGEKCGQFKREMPKPPGAFPGRGDFRGQPPGGAFPGRGEGLDRAPGAPDGERRTCRINGVEMPGPCPESSGPGGGMMGPGGFGPGGPAMGPGGFGPGGPEEGFGPSEEDMERMEQEQKARMLKEMKRGLRGMEMGLRMMDRGLNACRKAKIDTADANAALARIKEIVAKVRTAQDPDELMEFMEELPELFDQAREFVETCNRLRELPRITGQLKRDITRLEREHRVLTAQVKRAKFDLAEQLSDIANGIATAKAVLAEVQQVKDPDSFDEAIAKLETLHETFEDIREKIDTIRSVLNVRRAITEAKREIRRAEQLVASLKRKKVDTSALQALIQEGKAFLPELEALAKQRPLDVDALHEQFEAFEDLGERAEEEMARLRGREIKRGPKFGRSPVEGAKLPDAFRQFEREEEPEGPSELESLLGF